MCTPWGHHGEAEKCLAGHQCSQTITCEHRRSKSTQELSRPAEYLSQVPQINIAGQGIRGRRTSGSRDMQWSLLGVDAS